MADLKVFVPRSKMSANNNLSAFIEFCKHDLTVFGAELNWDANYWPESGVSFGNLDNRGPVLRADLVMRQPFLDFAKAYHRYRQGLRPSKPRTEMRALKCLERALFEAGGPVAVDRVSLLVLDRAADLCRSSYSGGLSYRAGRELEGIAKFLREKHLVASGLDWRGSIVRPSDSVRTGVKAREKRAERLPTQAVLDASAIIFASRPTDHRDIFTSATVAMLLSAPSRAGEVLSLDVNAEVEEVKRDGVVAYGWSFIPGKGGSPDVKWIPDVMTSISKVAFSRIRDMTNEGRRLASWLEDHPDKFYRHAGCPDVSDDKPLTMAEVAQALGYTYFSNADTVNTLRKIGFFRDSQEITLGCLNTWVHVNLPEDFPWFDRSRRLRFRDALFAMRARQLRVDQQASPVLLWRPTVNVLNNDLGLRETAPGYVQPNIFKRNVALLGGVSPGSVTSHQFRHHLNTIAQRGGLSQIEIARWSGRADPRQNRVYDHMTEFELSDMVRKQDSSLALDRSLNGLANHIQMAMPVTRQEFNLLTKPVVHITEIGFCLHDFVMSPCQRFRDCLNCSEQVCVKGDERLKRLRVQRDDISSQVKLAEEAIAEGSWGADRWYEINVKTLTRLNAFIAILDDPLVPDGAIIRLRDDGEFNVIKRAMSARALAHNRSTQLMSIRGGENG